MGTLFRQATLDDAEQIARIVCSTAAGIVETLLGNLVPGVDADVLLGAAFLRGEGAYRAENALCSREGDSINALLLSYPSSGQKTPPIVENLIPAKRLKVVRPFMEACVPDSLFVNTFWVEESLRGNGHADALMDMAVERCAALGFERISLFCWEDNRQARRFYEKHDFAVFSRIMPDGRLRELHPQGGTLLCREFSGGRA
jgi:GNAT superfamily N-acetyltransferase